MSKLTHLFTTLRRPALALALALPGLFAALPAEANVRTTMPGVGCFPDPYWDREGGTTLPFPNGALQWNSPSTDAGASFAMFCPLTRGLPLSTAGLSDLEVRLTATTAQASNPFCQAVSVRPDGTILVSHMKSVALAGNSTASLDFGGLINASASKGTYTLYCLVPLTVQLLSVYHSEVDGISGN